jgi:ADP-ribose pyrophosphatase YjhB (NUDIX family)
MILLRTLPYRGPVNAQVSAMATPRVSAGVVSSHGDTVLLVRPTYKDYWDVPGGYVEPGESPAAACRREVREELGLVVNRLTLASVDWAPHDREGDKLLFLFTALDPDPTSRTGVSVAAASFDDGEIAEARYVALSELDDYTIPRLVRRLRATVAAVNERRAPVYLEHGNPV